MSTLASDPEETTQWEKVRPRHVTPEQWKKFEGYTAEIFQAFGMDLDTPGTAATPSRYLHALHEATSGYEGDPKLVPWRTRLQHQPGHRRADRVLFAV